MQEEAIRLKACMMIAGPCFILFVLCSFYTFHLFSVMARIGLRLFILKSHIKQGANFEVSTAVELRLSCNVNTITHLTPS